MSFLYLQDPPLRMQHCVVCSGGAASSPWILYSECQNKAVYTARLIKHGIRTEMHTRCIVNTERAASAAETQSSGPILTSTPKPLRCNVLTPPHALASAQISTSKRLVSCGRGSCQSSDLFWAAGVFTQLGEWRSLTAFIVINHLSHDSFAILCE